MFLRLQGVATPSMAALVGTRARASNTAARSRNRDDRLAIWLPHACGPSRFVGTATEVVQAVALGRDPQLIRVIYGSAFREKWASKLRRTSGARATASAPEAWDEGQSRLGLCLL